MAFSASSGLTQTDATEPFREAYKEYPDTLIPEIHLFKTGEGPFKTKTGQIKQVRLLK